MMVKLTVSRLNGELIYERLYNLENDPVELYNSKKDRLWIRGLAEPIIGPWLIKVELVKS
jgi:hypothetical protein